MKKQYLALALAAATFLACNSGTSSNTADSTTMGSDSPATSMATTPATTDTSMKSAKSVSDMDKKFMMEAGAGGNTEVMASKIAVEKSTNAKVKDFANQMITDHTKAGDELKALAGQKNVTLPDSIMEDQHKALDDLRAKSGKDFDKAYVKMMEKDHKETVDKFQMASEKCEDSDVKMWASKTLPTLKMHKEHVDMLEKGM